MRIRVLGCLLLAGLATACTSDPAAPINQTTPIRQMDNFFSGRSDRPAPPPPGPPPYERGYDYPPPRY